MHTVPTEVPLGARSEQPFDRTTPGDAVTRALGRGPRFAMRLGAMMLTAATLVGPAGADAQVYYARQKRRDRGKTMTSTAVRLAASAAALVAALGNAGAAAAQPTRYYGRSQLVGTKAASSSSTPAPGTITCDDGPYNNVLSSNANYIVGQDGQTLTQATAKAYCTSAMGPYKTHAYFLCVWNGETGKNAGSATAFWSDQKPVFNTSRPLGYTAAGAGWYVCKVN